MHAPAIYSERQAVVDIVVGIGRSGQFQGVVDAIELGLGCLGTLGCIVKLRIPFATGAERPIGFQLHDFQRGPFVLPYFKVGAEGDQRASLGLFCRSTVGIACLTRAALEQAAVEAFGQAIVHRRIGDQLIDNIARKDLLIEFRTRSAFLAATVFAVLAVVIAFLAIVPFSDRLYTLISEPLLRSLPKGGQLIAIEVTSTFFVPVKLAFFAAALGLPTLDGLGADGDGAHAEHEHVVLSSLPDRAALAAGLIERLSTERAGH